MQPLYDRGTRRAIAASACEKCHGGALTLDVAFHCNNANRACSHLRGDLPEQIAFANRYVQAMTANSARPAIGRSTPRGRRDRTAPTYARIFLDKKHNAENMLMDDCLRCHGMHFEGGIRGPGYSGEPHGSVASRRRRNWPEADHAMPDVPRDASGRPADAESRRRRARSGAGAGNRATVTGVLRPAHAATTFRSPTCRFRRCGKAAAR